MMRRFLGTWLILIGGMGLVAGRLSGATAVLCVVWGLAIYASGERAA